MTGDATFELARLDGTATIRPHGELDLAARAAFEAALASVVGGSVSVVLEVDLAGVSFMDSSGIGVLAAARKQGHRIAVRRPQPNVRRALEISGMGDLLVLDP